MSVEYSVGLEDGSFLGWSTGGGRLSTKTTATVVAEKTGERLLTIPVIGEAIALGISLGYVYEQSQLPDDYTSLAPSSSERRVPDRRRQLKEFNDAVRTCEMQIGKKLSKAERRQLHDAITKQG